MKTKLFILTIIIIATFISTLQIDIKPNADIKLANIRHLNVAIAESGQQRCEFQYALGSDSYWNPGAYFIEATSPCCTEWDNWEPLGEQQRCPNWK